MHSASQIVHYDRRMLSFSGQNLTIQSISEGEREKGADQSNDDAQPWKGIVTGLNALVRS